MLLRSLARNGGLDCQAYALLYAETFSEGFDGYRNASTTVGRLDLIVCRSPWLRSRMLGMLVHVSACLTCIRRAYPAPAHLKSCRGPFSGTM